MFYKCVPIAIWDINSIFPPRHITWIYFTVLIFTSTATYKLKGMASVDTTSLLPKNCNRYTLTNYQLTYLIFESIVYILVLNSDLVYFCYIKTSE